MRDDDVYVISPEVLLRPGADATMLAMLGRRGYALAPAIFRVLALFSAPRSIAEALRDSTEGVDAAAFAAAVVGLARQGLLLGPAVAEAAAPGSLADAFEPAVLDLLPQISGQLAQGRAVVVRNALRGELAARVFQALDEAAVWQPQESLGYSPHYRHHVLAAGDEPPALAACRALFTSTAGRSFATRLTGRDCSGPPEFGATRYLPGDFATPHADAKRARSVAFVWHLARDWEPAWGGRFLWCPTGAQVSPTFNTLLLFNVAAETVHAVSPVSPHARGKRLSVTGWWSHAGAPAVDDRGGFDRWGLAPASYGAAAVPIAEALGVFAL